MSQEQIIIAGLSIFIILLSSYTCYALAKNARAMGEANQIIIDLNYQLSQTRIQHNVNKSILNKYLAAKESIQSKGSTWNRAHYELEELSTVQEKIKEYMEEHNVSQRKYAETAGITQSAVSTYLNNDEALRAAELKNFEGYLNAGKFKLVIVPLSQFAFSKD